MKNQLGPEEGIITHSHRPSEQEDLSLAAKSIEIKEVSVCACLRARVCVV